MNTAINSTPKRASKSCRGGRKRTVAKPPAQPILPFRPRRACARKGAGRKPKLGGAGVDHRGRAALASSNPVHVTVKLRSSLPGLRSKREYAVPRGASTPPPRRLHTASAPPPRRPSRRPRAALAPPPHRLRAASARGCTRDFAGTFRHYQYAIFNDHLHFLGEAQSRLALSPGLEGASELDSSTSFSILVRNHR